MPFRSSPQLHALDAAALRAWAGTALAELAAARDEIDAINVYPVADGDTGTNLYLTMESAVEALGHLPAEAGAAEVLSAMARGALRGARGNSGVILSEILRSLADVPGSRIVDTPALVHGLERAARAAYGAVANPVEGTMLTVLRAAAAAASGQPTLPALAAAAAAAARAALARTPDQLDVLRRAGVVDAGGRGICVLLDVLEGVVEGSTQPLRSARTSAATSRPSAPAEDLEGPSYEVMFLLEAPSGAINDLRTRLSGLGNSVAIGGEGTTWNVHAHVDDVAAALEAGLAAGRPHSIRICRLLEPDDPTATKERAVVCLVPSDGLADLLRTTDATVVNTSDAAGISVAARLLAALHTAGARELIVLPDNEVSYHGALAAAEQVRADGLQADVIPISAPVQALAALAVHDRSCAFDDAVRQMSAAAKACRHGSVPLNSVPLDTELVADVAARQVSEARAVVDALLRGGGEVLTLLTGSVGGAQLADAVAEHVRRTHPDVEAVTYDVALPDVVLMVGVE